MQWPTTVVSFISESRFVVLRGREIQSLQIVRNWLARLESFARLTISSDSKVGGLSCLIALSQ